MAFKTVASAALLLAQVNCVLTRPQGTNILKVSTSDVVQPGGLANIYLDWRESYSGIIEAIYASCLSPDTSSTQIIGRFTVDGHPPQRLAWAVSDDAPTDNCIYVHGTQSDRLEPNLLGKSEPVRLSQMVKKRSVADANVPLLKDFDSLGAWFDGVAAIKQKTATHGGVASSHSSKDSKIAIVGAGISGLATGLMLDSVGVHNWEIIEASDRVGGRFRTRYVAGTQEWAEMGPMRLPYSVTYKHSNETLR